MTDQDHSNESSGRQQQATASDVARVAGVSMSAVSRVFTPGASVSGRMRERVLAAAETLDYRPNVLARSLMTQKTGLIGIILANFHNPLFLDALEKFTAELQQRDLRVMVFNVSRGADVVESARQVMQYGIDGLVVAAASMSPPLVARCKKHGIPLVTFARQTRGHKVNMVCTDNVAGGRIAAKACLGRGARSVAYIGGPRESSTSILREKGFREALEEEAGVKLSEPIYAEAYTYSAGYAAALKLFQSGARPEALFCGSDLLACAGMDVARYRMGMRVPQDIGIVGFDDIELANADSYRLTTIRQPLSDMVRETVDILTDQIRAGNSLPLKRRILPCTLVERDSL